MEKKNIDNLKKKLEEQKTILEAELHKFAKKDKDVKGDWDTGYPNLGQSSGSQQLEEAADEVEEYVNRLPVEHSMELRLEKINLALEKIKNGTYGRCKECGKEISDERLNIYPEAEFCSKCQK